MKILFLTDNFPPESNPPASRTFGHIKEWAQEKDIQITVITSFPNFPFGKIYKGYKNKLFQEEIIEKIKVIRVWTYMAPNKGAIKRIIDQFSFAFTSFFAGLFQNYDIIIATSPHFFTTWSAFCLSKIKRKPWIFELRDIWPESIQTLGVIKNHSIISMLEKIELRLYKDADLVIPVTNSFKKNLIKRGIAKNKIKVVTNGVNSSLFKPSKKNIELINQLDIANKFIVGYIGTIGLAHGLDFIVRAIAKINDSSIHFIFVGDGAEKNKILGISKKLNINNITFINMVDEKKVVDFISVCDVSLVALKRNNTFRSVLPSKIFNSAGMKKPILLGVEGEAKELISNYSAGISYIYQRMKMIFFISYLN